MDIHTLHVEHSVLLAVYTLLTLVNARMHRGIRGIHWFSLYNALLFTGAVLVAMRGHMPDAVSIVGGNMFVIAGYGALFVSMAKFFGTRLWQISIQLTLAAAGLAAMLEFGWLHPGTEKRLLAYSIVLLSQQVHIALFTARRERRRTHASASMAVMLALLACMNLFRIVTLLVEGVPQDYLKVQGGLVWLVLINTALQCGAIVSYVWMTASLFRGDLAVQASTDHLTGLLNRRALEGAAAQVLAACTASRPVSAMVIDLDDFKGINDSFGHGCGDAALAAVGRALSLGLRHSDFVGRMGGDEFAAILPDTSFETACAMAAKLDEAIRAIRVSRGTGDFPGSVGVSATFGCAQADPPHVTWVRLLSRCDKHLYQAKRRRHQGDEEVVSDRDRMCIPS
jgi:diguanylate cyclase (GGDEF)-like protein